MCVCVCVGMCVYLDTSCVLDLVVMGALACVCVGLCCLCYDRLSVSVCVPVRVCEVVCSLSCASASLGVRRLAFRLRCVLAVK